MKKTIFIIAILIGFIVIFNACFVKNIGQKKQFTQDTVLATEYFKKGNEYLKSHNHDSAIIYYNDAVKINQTALKKDYTDLQDTIIQKKLSKCYNNIASVYYFSQDYINSLVYLEKTYKIRKNVYLENHIEIAGVCNNLGVISKVFLKDYDKALKYFNIALQIYKNNDKTQYYYAGCLKNIGSIYSSKGEYHRAYNYYVLALETFKKLEKEGKDNTKILFQISETYNSIGAYNERIKNYKEAEIFYKKALENINTISDTELYEKNKANYYFNLGNICVKDTDYTKAIYYQTEALTIRKKYNLKHYIAESHVNIGLTNLYQKKHKEAISEYDLAIEHYNLYGNEMNSEIAKVYIKKSNVYSEMENYSLALNNIQKSIVFNTKEFNDTIKNPKLNDIIFDYFLLLKSLHTKAKILNNTSLNKYLQYNTYRLCDSLIVQVRKTRIYKPDKLELSKISTEIYSEATEFSYQLYKQTDSLKYLQKAFYFSEKNKANLLNEAVAGIKNKDTTLRNIKIMIGYYQRQLSEYSLEKEKKYRPKLISELQKYDDYLNNNPNFSGTEITASLVQVQNFLKNNEKNTAIIEYFVTKNKLYTFVITSNQIKDTVILLDVNLEDNCSTYIKHISKIDKKAYVNLSWDLYDILIKPIENEIKNKKLIIIPDKYLSYLPFETLINKTIDFTDNFAEYQYLITTNEISYNYSATLWLNNPKRKKSEKNNFLGVAPVFYQNSLESKISPCNYNILNNLYDKNLFNNNDCSHRQIDNNMFFCELTNTKDEIQEISKLFNTKKCLEHSNATEENFLACLSEYKYIHIATHGYANDSIPEQSFLVFSQLQNIDCENEIENGILMADELYYQQLPNTNLVVLSACNTGFGALLKGEGLINMSHPWISSGVPNVIISLWSVNDKSTKELMVDFYKEAISNKKPYSEALQDSKIEMINSERFSFPYFWSAFVLIGN